MELRSELPIRGTKYPIKQHRHSRPKFNFLKNQDRLIECDKDGRDLYKNVPVAKDEYGIYKFKTVPQFKIQLGQETIGRLNPIFSDLFNEINHSKYILDFKDNWDENGSKSYKPNTWIKVVKFLMKFFSWRNLNSKILVKPPKIYQGPEGSIDIYWKSPSFTYLINIPEDDVNASYFYKTLTGTIAEGEFNIDTFNVDEIHSYFEESFI